MSLLVALLRIALSAVFAVAGITKLLDLRGTRAAVKNFGAPVSLVPALALLLPIVELSIAAGLLVDRAASFSALGALLLLAVFIIAISVNLALGRTHDCHCFGQLHSRPLGWPTLLRNIAFALGASFVLWQTLAAPVPRLFAGVVELESTTQFLLIGAVVVLVVMLILWHRPGTRTKALESEAMAALPLDSIAPAFELEAYHGGSRSLAQLIAHGKPLLLIFTNPTCGPCVSLFEEIKDWQRAHSDQLMIGLVSKGTIKDNFVNVARNSLGEVLLQKKREVAELYGALVTPTAIVINTSGRIASSLAAGADEIRSLLAKVLAESIGDKVERKLIVLTALIELQRLKGLDRTGWTLRGQPNGTESVAAHSFGVGVTAMLLADEVKARGLEVDAERVLRMALLHDWAETRVGDMPRTATNYFGAEVRKTAETQAFTDIINGIGGGEAAYLALYEDYEQRNSLEARLVKAADVIDLLVQAYALEKAGAKGLDEFWEVAHNADFHLPEIAKEVVEDVVRSLLDARTRLRQI